MVKKKTSAKVEVFFCCHIFCVENMESYMSVGFTGVWIANLSKSKFLGSSPKAISANISQSDAGATGRDGCHEIGPKRRKGRLQMLDQWRPRNSLNGRPVVEMQGGTAKS
jgi:hypothetical protein